MSQPTLQQLSVLDLVPFGNTGSQTGFYALRLSPPEWEKWSPGQFVMLRPEQSRREILWARPFSICSISGRDLVIFFQVRGRATALLERLLPGEIMNVWGPLGNSFAMEAKTPTLLLAGGIGIAPFVGYVQAHPTPSSITMEFAHRMPVDCYPFDSISEKVNATSHPEENAGDRSAFLQITERRIQEHAQAGGLVVACGPTPFLHVVQNYSRTHGARTQLCLETRMACGVGACLGCVVKSTAPAWAQTVPDGGIVRSPEAAACESNTEAEGGRYVQTCTCGPIFWADSVSFS